MALKDKLLELCERAGLTQQQLADRLYVTRQAVSLLGAVLPHLKRWRNKAIGE